MDLIRIPRPFHVCIDDLGWFCGKDDREIGGPSRSGMPRYHAAEDYIALENLGKAVTGGKFEEYKKYAEHTSYKITPKETKVIINL